MSVRFALVDVSGVYLASAGDELTINEPNGFSEFIFNIERDETYRGMTAEFGDGDTELGFSWNIYNGPFGVETVSPHEMLQSVFETVGYDAKILLRYYSVQGSVETLDYEWTLVFKDAEEEDALIKFIVKKEDFGDKFRTRFNTDVDVSGTKDLDDNTVSAMTMITLPLHSRDVQLISNGDWSNIVPLSSETNIPESTSGTYIALMPSVFSRDEIPRAGFQSNQYEVDPQSYIIVPYDGTYVFDINVFTQDGILSVPPGNSITNQELEIRAGETTENATKVVTGPDAFGVRSAEYTYTETFELKQGDIISISLVNPDADGFIFNTVSSYINITADTYYKPSTVQGNFIFEVLNDCINKSVGQEGRTVTVQTIGGGYTIGEQISAEFGTPHGLGTLISETDIGGGLFNLEINVSSGYFFEGDAAVGQTSMVSRPVNQVIYPDIIESSILSKTENGALTDGIGSLNFITTGKRIRQLPSPPLNVSAGKLIDFVRCRYNGGFQIVDDSGKKVVVEYASNFFQDVNIMTLSSVESPTKRGLNNDLLYNEVEAGYTKFAKENENNSIEGFNTKRNWLLPIEKEKKKLSLIAPVVTDGAEIERIRRLEIEQDQSDQSDEEVFVIKCQRFNSANKIESADNDNLTRRYVTIDDADNKIYLVGFYLEGQLASATEITLAVTLFTSTTQTITIDSVTYDAENNQTIINTTEAITASDGDYAVYSFYFDVDIFLPERMEAMSVANVSGVIDKYSEYNLDHTPTSFLLYWYNFLGATLITKDQTKSIKFTQGTNNVLLSKRYKTGAGITTSQIIENQDFQLESIRNINEEIFKQYVHEIVAYIDHDDFITLRKSLLGESGASPSTDFGYIEFTDNFGNLVQAFPVAIRRTPKTNKTEIIAWEKQVPTPTGTFYILQEDGNKIQLEDLSGFLELEH